MPRRFTPARRLRWLAVAVVLVAAACADDATTDPAPPDDGGTTSTSGPAASTTTLRPPVPTDPPEIEPARFGELEVPCGVPNGVSAPVGPGVDDATITIGTGNDRGGVATSGSGRGVVEAVEALVDHCNQLGGLADRTLLLEEYDAAGVEVAERVRAACDATVALVGHLYVRVLDALQAAAECPLPLFPAERGLVNRAPFPLHAHISALLIDPVNAATVGLVGPDGPLRRAELDRRARAVAADDGPLEVVATAIYPIDVAPDWDRLVGELRSQGAGQVHIAGGCRDAVVPFLAVAERVGWSPIVITGPDGYDPECLAAATADRLLVEVPFLPFEDGDAAPVTAELAAVLDRLDAPRTGNAVLATSAFWQWALAAPACGAELGHECLVAAVPPEAWTAGGLHVAVEPDGSSEPCAVVLGVEAATFVRRVPADPGNLECDPAWSVEVP